MKWLNKIQLWLSWMVEVTANNYCQCQSFVIDNYCLILNFNGSHMHCVTTAFGVKRTTANEPTEKKGKIPELPFCMMKINIQLIFFLQIYWNGGDFIKKWEKNCHWNGRPIKFNFVLSFGIKSLKIQSHHKLWTIIH